MKLFKKKEKSCCNVQCDNESMKKALEKKETGSRIKILGSGCAKCATLEKNVKEALNELGQKMSIEHITDFTEIASYGVMSTPALVLDGKVVSFGKVLTVEEVKKIIVTEEKCCGEEEQ